MEEPDESPLEAPADLLVEARPVKSAIVQNYLLDDENGVGTYTILVDEDVCVRVRSRARAPVADGTPGLDARFVCRVASLTQTSATTVLVECDDVRNVRFSQDGRVHRGSLTTVSFRIVVGAVAQCVMTFSGPPHDPFTNPVATASIWTTSRPLAWFGDASGPAAQSRSAGDEADVYERNVE